MKKIITLLIALPILFVGCSKEDSDSLDGTVWRAEKEFERINLPSYPGEPVPESTKIEEEYMFSFTKLTVTLKVNTTEYLPEGERQYSNEHQGDYRYEHPEIILNVGNGDFNYGKRDGNSLIFINNYGEEYVFTKQ
jgi:hypothetical protein